MGLWVILAIMVIVGYLLVRGRKKAASIDRWREEERLESTDFDYTGSDDEPGKILKILKTLRHAIEYLAVVCFYGIIRIIPKTCKPALVAMLGSISYACTIGRVRIAIGNLRSVFPDHSPAELRTIVRQVYYNLVANAIDVVHTEQAVKLVDVGG